MNYIDETATLGADVRVWHFARVLAYAELGDFVSVGGGAEIGAYSFIGHHTRVGAGVFLPSHSRVGHNVFIGPNVTFTDDRHPRANNPEYKAEPPTIGHGASIGAGATILPGVQIGANAMVGAGCVVCHDVPEGHVVYSIQNTCQKKRKL
jgi:acetyltransferase-like isoleucine patch superfamily enzyme